MPAAIAFFLYLVYFHTRQRLVVLSWSTSPQNTSFQREWGNVGEQEVVPQTLPLAQGPG